MTKRKNTNSGAAADHHTDSGENASQGQNIPAPPETLASDDMTKRKHTNSGGAADQWHDGDNAQTSRVPTPPETLAATIEAIKAAHRERNLWMEKRIREDNSLGSFLRTALGWSMQRPKAERDAIKKQATELVAAGEAYIKARRRAVAKIEKLAASGKPDLALAIAMPSQPALAGFAHVILNAIEMRRKTDELEADAKARMERLGKTLPAFEWASQERGLGALGVAILAAEVGNLSLYPTKSKLHKRLGVAVRDDGRRQGMVPKSLTGAERKRAWIDEKYSPSRRSRLAVLGMSVLMSGNERYRQIYLDRKAYEIARAEAEGLIVAPFDKIPKKRAAEYRSLKHIHNRSRRYMEKRVVTDLWRAWRRLTRSVGEADQSPVGPNVAQVETVPSPADPLPPATLPEAAD